MKHLQRHLGVGKGSDWPQILWELPAQDREKAVGGNPITSDINQRRDPHIRHQTTATCNFLHFYSNSFLFQVI